jgi:hypothetical protein
MAAPTTAGMHTPVMPVRASSLAMAGADPDRGQG